MSDIQRSERSIKVLQVAYDRSSPGSPTKRFATWGLGAVIIAAMTVWIGFIAWGLFAIFPRLLTYF
jgi:hypothetical protein